MGSIKELIEYLLNAIKIWVIVQPWQTALIVRGGNKIRKVSSGIYFRLPYFDSVYVQENRLRVTEMPMQTLTSKDIKTITLNSSFGYSILDIRKLYETLYHPEKTLQNIAMSEVANFIWNNDLNEITPESLEKSVLNKLKIEDYGIGFEYFKITNFAVVRTFRLIQDQSWICEGMEMNQKK